MTFKGNSTGVTPLVHLLFLALSRTYSSIIGPPKQDRKQGMKTRTIGSSVFTFIHFPDVRMFPYISRATGENLCK